MIPPLAAFALYTSVIQLYCAQCLRKPNTHKKKITTPSYMPGLRVYTQVCLSTLHHFKQKIHTHTYTHFEMFKIAFVSIWSCLSRIFIWSAFLCGSINIMQYHVSLIIFIIIFNKTKEAVLLLLFKFSEVIELLAGELYQGQFFGLADV